MPTSTSTSGSSPATRTDDFDTGAIARRYERKVLDPTAWAEFGASGFYDVGLWGPGVTTQREACEALVDRLVAGVPAGVARVLDVGCGAGSTTDRVRRRLRAGQALGIDVAPGLVGVARRRHPACAFAVMDGAAPGLADASVDVVTCVEAAFHFRSRRRFIERAAEVLRPGGRLVLADLVVADTELLGRWMMPPENRMAAGGYAAMVEAAGFDDVVVEDATQTCWRAYCRSAGVGAADETLRDYFAALEHGAVEAYLLVSATKRRPATRRAGRPPTAHRSPGRG